MNVREADSATYVLPMLREALESGSPIDLLIIDWSLKGGNADGLLAQISGTKEFAKIPLLLLVPLDGDHFHHKAVTEFKNLKTLNKPMSCSTFHDSILLLLFPEESELQAKANAGAGRRYFEPLPDGHKIRILVAEDNKVNQIVVNAILGEAGLICDIAQNGQEAYDRFLEGEYNLVLMDCQMPQVDGYEATGMIRRWEEENSKSRIPIIALTANAVTGDIQRCLDSGMDAYCSKPIDPIHLFETITRLFREKR
jgi:CheY-like chemotaxis protein